MTTAITIGNFDGVHLGHRALVQRATDVADEVVAITFEPHPRAVLDPEHVPAILTPIDLRRRRLLDAGATTVRALTPTCEMLATEPEDFLRSLLDEHAPDAIVEGDDFRFGRRRRGDVEMLRRLAARLGIRVEIVDPVDVVLNDHTVVKASSTIVRWLVEQGRVDDASKVLGDAYTIRGTAVRGDRKGRELGFPTVNVRTDQVLPADAIYGAIVTLPDGREVIGATSVGTKPTFGGEDRVLETHLLDVERDGAAIRGLDEYGWRIELRFLHWVRDQARFPSLDALVAQIGRDCDRIRSLTTLETG